MGYYEDQQKAAADERQQVRMGNADPSQLTTISGNMAWKDQQADKQSWVSSSSAPAFPTFTSPSRAGQPFTSPAAPVPVSEPRSARPHVPDWTDRLMQSIPRSILVVFAIVGASIGYAAGSGSGGAVAVLYALLGAGAGLLALPAAIKLAQLALRILAVAAVVGIVIFIFWALAHAGN